MNSLLNVALSNHYSYSCPAELFCIEAGKQSYARCDSSKRVASRDTARSEYTRITSPDAIAQDRSAGTYDLVSTCSQRLCLKSFATSAVFSRSYRLALLTVSGAFFGSPWKRKRKPTRENLQQRSYDRM